MSKEELRQKNAVNDLTAHQILTAEQTQIPFEQLKDMNLYDMKENKGKKAFRSTRLVVENGFNNYYGKPYDEETEYLYFSDFGFVGISRVQSQRLTLFLEKGTVCACCGLEGTFLLKKSNHTEKKIKSLIKENSSEKLETTFHVNLFAKYKGKNILMTKDHIEPKSKGGLNIFDNYTTCCTECNRIKGNTPVSIEELSNLILKSEDLDDLREIVKPLGKNNLSKDTELYSRVKNRIIENGGC